MFRTYKIFPEDELTSVVVEPGMTHEIDFHMQAGSRLSWNFKTENLDIGFRLVFEDGKEIIPNHRVDAHVFVQRGEIVCEQTGRCESIFNY